MPILSARHVFPDMEAQLQRFHSDLALTLDHGGGVFLPSSIHAYTSSSGGVDDLDSRRLLTAYSPKEIHSTLVKLYGSAFKERHTLETDPLSSPDGSFSSASTSIQDDEVQIMKSRNQAGLAVAQNAADRMILSRIMMVSDLVTAQNFFGVSRTPEGMREVLDRIAAEVSGDASKGEIGVDVTSGKITYENDSVSIVIEPALISGGRHLYRANDGTHHPMPATAQYVPERIHTWEITSRDGNTGLSIRGRTGDLMDFLSNHNEALKKTQELENS